METQDIVTPATITTNNSVDLERVTDKRINAVKLSPHALSADTDTFDNEKDKWTHHFNYLGFIHMFLGGKERIVRMVPTHDVSTCKTDKTPLQVDFMERTAFKNRFAHLPKAYLGKGSDDKPVYAKPVDIWLSNNSRNLSDNVCFNPEEPPLTINSSGQLNLYQGRAVNPAECSREKSVEFLKPFLDHLLANLCKSDKESFWTFIKVMAVKYQNPTIKPFATIIHGIEGTGKDTIVEPFMNLYGAHGKKATKAEQVIGTYNAGTLSGCLFLWMDEAFAGTKEATDCMKTVVFSEKLYLTNKFIPEWEERVLNQTILTTNRDNMIRFAINDRRYFVLEMSEEPVGDSDYFTRLWKLIDNKDFLHHLANLLVKTNTEGFDFRKPPVTQSKAVQTLSTADAEQRFVFKMIREGGFRPLTVNDIPEGQEPIFRWPEKIHATTLTQAFEHWLRDTRTPFASDPSIKLSRALRKVGFKKKKSLRLNNEVRAGWELPTIEQARSNMSKVLGFDIDKLDN